MDLKVRGATLRELRDELSRLCRAGYADSIPYFSGSAEVNLRVSKELEER